ncbi:MAG: Ig-like domain-containing protein, partial [Bacteroidetes bacterium]|nr:Ig-like domain-containing protein [Bacteroidota bacterium]
MKKNLLTVFFTLLVSLVSINAQSQACGGVCSGFRTQTQGGWGATPNGGNPGVYLHNNFAAAFPSGLTIGSGTKTVKFTTAQSITDNLPAGGGPTSLPSGNVVDPASGYLNTELDGQIIAAMLSVGFDANDASFSISSGVLGNLVFNSGVFNGKSVQFVIDEANKAIGSVGSSYSLTDINTALTSFNENYDNGTAGAGNGNFNCPGTPPVVADIIGTTTICKDSTSTLTDATIGGVWSSDNNAVATVNASGLVTPVIEGTVNISYTVTNGCGTGFKSVLVTIQDCSGVGSGG